MKRNIQILKSLGFATLILGSCAALQAQSVQHGTVMLYHGKEAKTPLNGVSISAVGAPASMSDADGKFVLNFRTLHEGDAIQFRRVELAGYEVMNQEAIDVARIARGDDQLTIVMASVEDMRQLREGYRSVAAERYQKQYDAAQRQLEQLQKDGKIKQEEYDKQLDALEEKYEAQLQTLDTYVDKFARIDLSDLDEFEQEIIALVQEGKFDEAIAKYEEQNLTERLQRTVQEQRQLNSDVQKVDSAIEVKQGEATRLEQNIDKQIDLLQKVGGDENLRKAEELRKAKQ